MSSDHSVTKYFAGLRDGESGAAQQIWERFISQLTELARRKLATTSKRVADEDDVVQVVFSQFFAQVQEGRFSRLNDRNDLWSILAMLVDRRVIDQQRKLLSSKAGGGFVRGDSAFALADGNANGPGVVASEQPAVEISAAIVDEIGFQLRNLKSEKYRDVISLKLQGHTHQEVAKTLKMSLRSVERILGEIRKKWQQGLD